MNIGSIIRTNFADMPSTPISGVRGVTRSESYGQREFLDQYNSRPTDATGLTITPEKQKFIDELKLRDAEVRTHKQVRSAASGGIVKDGDSPSYTRGLTSPAQDQAVTTTVSQMLTQAEKATHTTKTQPIHSDFTAFASNSTAQTATNAKHVDTMTDAVKNGVMNLFMAERADLFTNNRTQQARAHSAYTKALGATYPVSISGSVSTRISLST